MKRLFTLLFVLISFISKSQCSANTDSLFALNSPYVVASSCSLPLQESYAERASNYFLRALCIKNGLPYSLAGCPANGDSVLAYSFPYLAGSGCSIPVQATPGERAEVFYLRKLVTYGGGGQSGAAGGDLTGAYPNPTIAKIQGTPISGASSNNIPNTLVLRSANGNAHANNFESAITTFSSGAVFNTTIATPKLVEFSGSGASAIIMPNATTLRNGHTYEFNNNTTATSVVEYNGSHLPIFPLNPKTYVTVTLLDSSTVNGVWDYHWQLPSFYDGISVHDIYSGYGIKFSTGGDITDSGTVVADTTSGTGTAKLATEYYVLSRGDSGIVGTSGSYKPTTSITPTKPRVVSISNTVKDTSLYEKYENKIILNLYNYILRYGGDTVDNLSDSSALTHAINDAYNLPGNIEIWIPAGRYNISCYPSKNYITGGYIRAQYYLPDDSTSTARGTASKGSFYKTIDLHGQFITGILFDNTKAPVSTRDSTAVFGCGAQTGAFGVRAFYEFHNMTICNRYNSDICAINVAQCGYFDWGYLNINSDSILNVKHFQPHPPKYKGNVGIVLPQLGNTFGRVGSVTSKSLSVEGYYAGVVAGEGTNIIDATSGASICRYGIICPLADQTIWLNLNLGACTWAIFAPGTPNYTPTGGFYIPQGFATHTPFYSNIQQGQVNYNNTVFPAWLRTDSLAIDDSTNTMLGEIQYMNWWGGMNTPVGFVFTHPTNLLVNAFTSTGKTVYSKVNSAGAMTTTYLNQGTGYSSLALKGNNNNTLLQLYAAQNTGGGFMYINGGGDFTVLQQDNNQFDITTDNSTNQEFQFFTNAALDRLQTKGAVFQCGTSDAQPFGIITNGGYGLYIDANKHVSLGSGTNTQTTASLKIFGAGTATVPLQYVSGSLATTAVTGGTEYDGSNLYFTPISTQRYTEPLTIFTTTADALDSNSSGETSILSSTGVGSLTLPANLFVAGRTIHIAVKGYHSAASAPNITIKVKLGSTVVCTTGAVASGNSTNTGFEIDAVMTCRTVGTSGIIMGEGSYREYDNPTNSYGMAQVSGVAVNTTTTQAITVTATWGTAATTNVINGKVGYVEIKN